MFTCRPFKSLSSKSLLEGLFARVTSGSTFCSSTAKETVVLNSSSNDPYQNLALEDWFYQNEDMSKKRIIFIYRNKPTVVIGRFQNPWHECRVSKLKRFNTLLVRRKSGGGTVFHDLGNMNISVLTSAKEYDRPGNLSLVANALQRNYNINAAPTKRHDILIDDKYKISGTAAKVGRNCAYHHFTLLFDTSMKNLQELLYFDQSAITSKATSSVQGTVLNLSEKIPSVEYDELQDVVSQEFFKKYTGNPGTVVNVNPTDTPGVDQIIEELQSWEWNFGKTPDFTFRKQIQTSCGELEVVFKVSSGIVHFIEFNIESTRSLQGLLMRLADVIRGSRYSKTGINSELGMFLAENSDIIPDDELQVCKELCQWLSDNM